MLGSGSETLSSSRCMIEIPWSTDGAGASIIEASEDETGMLSYESATYAIDEAHYLFWKIL
jgi:hypothetical protein